MRLGSQTPAVSVTIPYLSTAGPEAVEIYERTGRTAQPWQASQLDHILATNDDGLYTHMTYGLAVPRRNGKNEVLVMRELYGLEHGQRMCHTAHRTTTSSSAFRRLYNMLIDLGYVEQNRKKKNMPERSFWASKGYGLESIELTGGGCIFFRTRTNGGGLGEGFDLLVIDEAQEYTEKQQSALVYTVSDSQNPQTIFCGTPPTAVSAGTVFAKMRAEILGGKMQDAGWAEWSIEDIPQDPMDVELWYKTNPSLGTILSERNVRAEYKGDLIDFAIQRLGVWISYDQKAEISEAEWAELKADKAPRLQKKRYLGIKYGKDGRNAAMSVAAKTTDGRVFVETIACYPVKTGNAWMMDYFKNPNLAGVVVDGQPGQVLLAKEMTEAGAKKPRLPKVDEVISANAMFEQTLYSKGLVHTGQPTLAAVVSHCEKRPIGSNGGFGYRSIDETLDIAIMDSMILALWLCLTDKEKKPQKIQY